MVDSRMPPLMRLDGVMAKPSRGGEVLSLGSFVVLGLPDGMLGTAWPSLRGTFGAPVGELGLILLLATAGSVLVTAFVGRLILRLGVPALLAAAGLTAGAGGAERLTGPQVGDVRRSAEPKLGQRDAETMARRAVGVEHADVPGAVTLPLIEDLLIAAADHPVTGNAVLVDPDHRVVLQHGQVRGVQVSQISTEDQRGAGERPQRHHRLPLRHGKTVVAPVTDLKRVIVIPAAGTAVGLPACRGGEPAEDMGPGGEGVTAPARLAAVALDVAGGAPAVSQRRPGGRIRDGQGVGERSEERRVGK